MSWLLRLLGLVLAALVVLFALSNRQPVTIGLWPLDEGMVLAVYLAVLVPLLVGLLLGWALAGRSGLARQFRMRAQARRIVELEQSLAAARGSPPLPNRDPAAAPP